MVSKLPAVEKVADKVHEAWMASKRTQGITSRKSETDEELMVPYAQLSEAAKDLDRNTVKAVFAALTPMLKEPSAVQVIDVYVGQVINGLLSQGGYSHLHDQLAERAFSVAKALMSQRSNYFAPEVSEAAPAAQ